MTLKRNFLMILGILFMIVGCKSKSKEDVDSGVDAGMPTDTLVNVHQPTDAGSPIDTQLTSDSSSTTGVSTPTDTDMMPPTDTTVDSSISTEAPLPTDTQSDDMIPPTDTIANSETATDTQTTDRDDLYPTDTQTETEGSTPSDTEEDGGIDAGEAIPTDTQWDSPDGGEDSDVSTDTYMDAGIPLSIIEVIPQAVSREVEETLLIIGTGFDDGMTVSLFNENVITEPILLGQASVETDGASATIQLPADTERPQGLYDLTVTNLSEESATYEGALFISSLSAPTVNLVEPALAWQGDPLDERLSDRSVQISGEGFVNTPWVRLINNSDPDISYQAREVYFIDDETLIAVVPSESGSMASGSYHVWVTNPDQLAGQWIDSNTDEPGLFEITETPAPAISGIDPVQYPFNDTCTPFTVTGMYFNADAILSIVTPDGDIPLEITTAEETTLVSSIPANTLETGFYPVKVTNPDGQEDLFYAFETKNPTDGHFYGDFELVPSELTHARERLALAYGFDDFSGTHLYASGGLNENNEVLDDVETATINIYGQVGSWTPAMQWQDTAAPRVLNRHVSQRQGHALVRVGEYLFALGGSASDTSINLDETLPALASVESAKILGTETMPTASAPEKSGDGLLPDGTWYYRVSALGAWGEGLASNEVQLLNGGGAIAVCWSTVADATGYNLYRSAAADGRPGTTRLLTTVAAETSDETQCATDDGLIHPAPGFVSAELQTGGALAEGIWIYRISATIGENESIAGYTVPVTTESGSGSVTLRWSEVPGATYAIYRTDTAATELVGGEQTFLLASGVAQTEWTDDGTASIGEETGADDGISVLPAGSISRWLPLATDMGTPREGLGAVAVTFEEATYIYAVGGRPNGGGSGYLATVEMAEVLDNGLLGEWQTSTSALNTGRAFFSLVSTQPQGMSPLSPDPIVGSVTDNLFLFAIAGDESFSDTGSNQGMETIEGVQIDTVTGLLQTWVVQDSDLSLGRRTYGNGGAFIDNYLYCFPGVDTEVAGVNPQDEDLEPAPLSSVSTRFEVVQTDPLSDPYSDLLTNYMSSNGGLFVPRSYYGTVRTNAHIYVVGGNDGNGPVSSIESIRQ